MRTEALLLDTFVEPAGPASRRARQTSVRWGSRIVAVGGDAPVRVQSMTNTDTVDLIATAIQVKELALAGSEMVRITVNTPKAAAAVCTARWSCRRSHRPDAQKKSGCGLIRLS